jgi:predicted neuraminidase
MSSWQVGERGFVFDDDGAPSPSCHASTIAVLGDGSEVVAWFGGTREGHEDVAIWSSRRDRTAGAWSMPALVAKARDVPCWNPVLHATPEGDVHCFYKVGPSPQTWSGRVTTSGDGGRTWGPRRPLPPGVVGPSKNKPMALPGGALLCPSSTESHLAWGAWFEETEASLRSWWKHGPVFLDGVGIIQPALLGGDGDDHVVALCRTANAGFVARTESFDRGRTWSAPSLLDVPHNNSGLDAVRLEAGPVALVANAVPSGRSPLHVLVSDDLGRTFGPAHVVDDEAGELSYPSAVADGDGIRVVYTSQRRRIAYVRLRYGPHA